MGVYQRRENLRFYGIEEDPEGAEHTWQVLMDFVQPGLSIDDASDIEFQRVHRIGPFNQQAPKPRQIIARFLHYPDRERVMSNARKLKFRKFGISATCLKKSLIDGREKAQVCQPLLYETSNNYKSSAHESYHERSATDVQADLQTNCRSSAECLQNICRMSAERLQLRSATSLQICRRSADEISQSC
ncbi:hypothetical protein P5673_005369 [Acropora cervicornis]|uniref:Uncharacterized protein n=1 Tax=Acropora cervicornis TaxID=6130 RepID=A0AAD9QXX8_ACRCE|nr:hypothetical protein P5673_005369 [Acropora cervicornis]